MLLIYLNALAQDFIVKRDGSEIEGKVREILDETIKYSLKKNPGTLRQINKQEVSVIIYEGGYRETFLLKNEINPENKKDDNEEIPLGWILQGQLGVTFPFDENISEIYEYLPVIGITSGYWGKWFGVELMFDYSRKDGEPITLGSVNSGTSTLTISSLTFCGYFANNTLDRKFFM